MAHRIRLKPTTTCATIALAISVATFASSPLFAQARAEIQASATVLNTVAPVSVSVAAQRFINHYYTRSNATTEQLAGGVAQLRVAKERAAKPELLQPVVITVEYAAN